MAKIREDFVGVVHAYVGTESVFLPAGAEVPEGVTVHESFLAEGEDTEDAEGENTEDEEAYPGDDAHRADLDAYATSVGLTPADYKNKSDLIAAIKAAE